MKICPVCKSENEDSAQRCWECEWELSPCPVRYQKREERHIVWGRMRWLELATRSSKEQQSWCQNINAELNQASQERQDILAKLDRFLEQDQEITGEMDGPKPVSQEPVLTLDYTLLAQLLEGNKWREADLETTRLMLAVMGCERLGYLDDTNLKKFPCTVLGELDRLWEQASNGHFGLNIQKELYLNLGGKGFINPQVWQKMAETVGWYAQESWLTYEQLNFTLKAPPGHLPVLGDGQIWFVGGWRGNGLAFSSLMSRLIQCMVFLNKNEI